MTVRIQNMRESEKERGRENESNEANEEDPVKYTLSGRLIDSARSDMLAGKFVYERMTSVSQQLRTTMLVNARCRTLPAT